MPITCLAVIHIGYLGNDSVIKSAPTGAYANSGWQWQGDWGSGNGTVVSPTQILTVNHYGASTFTYNGNTYNQVSAVTNGDLKLVTLDTSVHGDFGSWASIYRGSSEVGSEFAVFGQGRDRGSLVSLSGDPKGWQYGTSGTRRWGTNIFDATASSVDGPLLVADFDATGGTSYEAHLSTWDSGGGAFIEIGGQWQLAGVNYSVDAFFNTSPTDTGRFMAALHDMGGFYVGSDASGWTIVPDQPSDIPSRLYMHRVSENEAWLDANIVVPEPRNAALLTVLLALATLTTRRCPSRGSRKK